MKILCLGNEFIKEDSLAKKIGLELEKSGFEIINIKDSFQLMGHVNNRTPLIILDVVSGLKEVKMLNVDDIKSNGIMTAHDFDAGFILKLLGKDKKIKIIGIPIEGDVVKIARDVKKLLQPINF